jgi:hypothetical protein
MMGHGNRWDAFAGDAKEALPKLLPLLFANGVVVAGKQRTFTWPANHGGDVDPDMVPVAEYLEDGPFGLLALSAQRRAAKELVFMTAYPMPLAGTRVHLRVREVQEDCHGLEGWITCETESEMSLSFFATDYFVDPRRYRPGNQIDVNVGGLAYSARTGESSEIVIDDPKVIRRYQDLGMDLADGVLRIKTKGAAMLIPLEGWEPFDYQFRGPVLERELTHANARLFDRLVVTVARPGDDSIDLPILVGEHVCKGELPAVGDDVSSTMCIMGHLADYAWPGPAPSVGESSAPTPAPVGTGELPPPPAPTPQELRKQRIAWAGLGIFAVLFVVAMIRGANVQQGPGPFTEELAACRAAAFDQLGRPPTFVYEEDSVRRMIEAAVLTLRGTVRTEEITGWTYRTRRYTCDFDDGQLVRVEVR